MWSIVVGCLLPLALGLRYTVYRRESSGGGGSGAQAVASDLSSISTRYLAVFCVVKLADWLQGPYFYQLYAEKIDSRTGKPFTTGAISSLFLLGFAASVVAGVFLGGLVDRYGRRLGCLLCCVVYFLDCLLVHSDSYLMLGIGRVMAGVASALLNTVFEAWFIGETSKHTLPTGWLGSVVSLQWFLDGVVAVISGMVAQSAATAGGPVAVFDLSAAMLALAFFLILALWGENTGSSSGDIQVGKSLSLIFSSRRLLTAGCVQALFGGAMYSFVLVWVPVMQVAAANSKQNAPLGLIFSAFMVCIMVGSSTFSLLSASPFLKMAVLLFVATVSLLLPAIFSQSVVVVSLGFLLFEACCGVYFPSSACIRSEIVPEAYASSILSLFRVPLNGFVVVLLMNLDWLGSQQALLICAVSLGTAALLQVSDILLTGRVSKETIGKED